VKDLLPRAIAAGALVAVAICLPLAALSQVVAAGVTGDPPALILLLFVGVLAGFSAGGYVAAGRAPSAPYSNGALAAVAAFAAIQLVAVVTQTIRGEPVAIASILFNALIAYSCGLVGSLLASRRTTPETDTP
jgi:hypothetical protein